MGLAVIRLRGDAASLLIAVLGIAAAVTCLLPWERVEVRSLGGTQTRLVSSFHGSGIAACVGAALALLMLADRLLRPPPSRIRDAGLAFAGTLLAVGAALFTMTGGYSPVSADLYGVAVLPGLFLAGVSGLLLLTAAAVASWRRAGSRSPESSG